jgi:sulfur carrier protein
MDLLINGEKKNFSDGLSLGEVIQQLGVRKETVVAEVNRRIVRTVDLAQWKLSDGDQVELIQFVGGG